MPFSLGCSGAYSFDFLHAVARVGYDLLVGTARKARRCVPVQFDRIIIRAVVQLPIDRLAQLGIAENAEQKQMLAAAELQEAGPWTQLLRCTMPANQSQIPLTSL